MLKWYFIQNTSYIYLHSREKLSLIKWNLQTNLFWIGLDTILSGIVSLGKLDWGVSYVIIFLFEQFWIRLAPVSKRGKKIRTVAFPAVRSVDESRDTRNCAQNKPQNRICGIFTTRSYYKALELVLCYLI